MLSDEGYALLHEVRLRGLLEIDGIGDGADRALVVVQLREQGLVVSVRSSIRITSVGRILHEQWARVSHGSDTESAVARGYERFGPLNVEFLRTCHDWQVRPGNIPNDHRDAPYDWSVMDRLHALDERTGPIIRRVARSLERFGAYPIRLRHALRRIDEGDHEWFTSPRIDSYHTVWMQMHEEFLLALGRSREDEAQI